MIACKSSKLFQSFKLWKSPAVILTIYMQLNNGFAIINLLYKRTFARQNMGLHAKETDYYFY